MKKIIVIILSLIFVISTVSVASAEAKPTLNLKGIVAGVVGESMTGDPVNMSLIYYTMADQAIQNHAPFNDMVYTSMMITAVNPVNTEDAELIGLYKVTRETGSFSEPYYITVKPAISGITSYTDAAVYYHNGAGWVLSDGVYEYGDGTIKARIGQISTDPANPTLVALGIDAATLLTPGMGVTTILGGDSLGTSFNAEAFYPTTGGIEIMGPTIANFINSGGPNVLTSYNVKEENIQLLRAMHVKVPGGLQCAMWLKFYWESFNPETQVFFFHYNGIDWGVILGNTKEGYSNAVFNSFNWPQEPILMYVDKSTLTGAEPSLPEGVKKTTITGKDGDGNSIFAEITYGDMEGLTELFGELPLPSDFPEENILDIDPTAGNFITLRLMDIEVEEGSKAPYTFTFNFPDVNKDSKVFVFNLGEGIEYIPCTVGDGTITVTFEHLSPVFIYADSSTLTQEEKEVAETTEIGAPTMGDGPVSYVILITVIALIASAYVASIKED